MSSPEGMFCNTPPGDVGDVGAKLEGKSGLDHVTFNFPLSPDSDRNNDTVVVQVGQREDPVRIAEPGKKTRFERAVTGTVAQAIVLNEGRPITKLERQWSPPLDPERFTAVATELAKVTLDLSVQLDNLPLEQAAYSRAAIAKIMEEIPAEPSSPAAPTAEGSAA